jgi:hypothetical protein
LSCLETILGPLSGFCMHDVCTYPILFSPTISARGSFFGVDEQEKRNIIEKEKMTANLFINFFYYL